MGRAKKVAALVLAASMLTGAGARTGAGSVDAQRIMNARSEPGNWLTHGGSYAEQRFADLGQINAGNVSQLGLAWSVDLDTSRGQEATPIVVDGTMFTTTAWSKVMAIDAVTGRVKWRFDPQVDKARGHSACCDVVNRGVAVWNGLVFVAALDGRLIALDADTGKQKWSSQTFIDTAKPYTMTGAPRVVKGMVIIGNGGAELGVRGYVTAYDAATGKKKWRFFTVPGDPAKGPDGEASDSVLAGKAAPTWYGDYWKGGAGGTAWDAIVYDQELDQLYIGVGNGSPWNHQIRSEGKGDNLFLSSVLALKPETGEYLWHYQGTPGETWDYTATQPIILSTLMIEGRPRKVLMQAPKNGFFYVIDRVGGQLISARSFATQTWATGVDLKTGRPIEVPEARYRKAGVLVMPSPLGAHNWQPMSFSPRTGLVYLPAQEIPQFYEAKAGFERQEGGWNLGISLAAGGVPDDRAQFKAIKASLKGKLIAWDPVAQKPAWEVGYDGPWNGGTLATAGNLVFQGNGAGTFQAFNASTGAKLWSFDAQTGIIAGAVSYAVKGEQYVAVMAGYGGAYPLTSGFEDPREVRNGRVLVFKLGGKRQLPRATQPVFAAANPPKDMFTPAQVTEGGTIYAGTCAFCHGPDAYSSGILPDLRRSAVLTDADAWKAIVHDGALKANGMVAFSRWYTPAQLEAVRAYVGEQAKKLQVREATTAGK
ncbi:MAG: PQQ-dependent dehydrogenase, methanol/ethanol family [Sandarakinorhabdus sp.]